MNDNFSQHKIPLIAIIGKPNVGKSSLFNRLAGRKIAIITDQAGTTRDRVFARVRLNNFTCGLIDTAGLSFEDNAVSLETDMQSQAEIAIKEADLVIFMVEGKKDPTQDDYVIADILRKKSKNIILAANKIDHLSSNENLATWCELGLGMPLEMSVTHNKNINLLEEQIGRHLSRNFTVEENHTEKSDIKIAFIGRPNAGKSSLVNSLLGQERVVISDQAGTTRDAIDTELTQDGQNYTLIDTAGLRRRGKIERGIEKYSSFRTINAIERADVVCLLLDYTIGIRAQDLHITSYILEACKGLIILVNKSDLMEDKEAERNRIGNVLRHRFAFLTWAPILFISAKNNFNTNLILDTAKEIVNSRKKEIDHIDLYNFLQETFHKHKPPLAGRKKLLFYDLVQIPSTTPTFEFLINVKQNVHFAYKRYLENEFREKFDYNGTAIRFYFKEIDKKLLKKTEPV